jgi:hypothetical protein
MTKTLKYFVTGCNVLGIDRVRLATLTEGATAADWTVNNYLNFECAT